LLDMFVIVAVGFWLLWIYDTLGLKNSAKKIK